MDEGDQVVDSGVEETTQAESTTAEQTPEDLMEAPEKAEITQEDTEESSLQQETKAVPYERFKEVNDRQKALEAELAQFKAKAEVLDKLQASLTPQEPKDPVTQRADEKLKEMGYVRKDDVERLVEERIQSTRVEDSFMSQVSELEQKYNGKDGLPKFDVAEVAKFMDTNPYYKDANGFPDVEKTFKAMHLEEFTDSVAKQKRGTAFSEKPGKQMASSDTDSKADFEEAAKTGDWGKYVLGRIGSPFSKE